MDAEFLKLEIFIPKTHFTALQQALCSVDAGHIGNYDCCLSYSEVHGCWRPLPGTHPYQGEENQLCWGTEYKVEVCCTAQRLDETLKAVKQIHPYEEPVINVLPLLHTGL